MGVNNIKIAARIKVEYGSLFKIFNMASILIGIDGLENLTTIPPVSVNRKYESPIFILIPRISERLL